MTESLVEKLIKLYEDGKKLYITRSKFTFESDRELFNDDLRQWNARTQEIFEKFFPKKQFIFNNPTEIRDEILEHRLKFLHKEIVLLLESVDLSY